MAKLLMLAVILILLQITVNGRFYSNRKRPLDDPKALRGLKYIETRENVKNIEIKGIEWFGSGSIQVYEFKGSFIKNGKLCSDTVLTIQEGGYWFGVIGEPWKLTKYVCNDARN